MFGEYAKVLATGAPGDVGLALRLRVKLATTGKPSQRRTLLDIAAIDFPA